MSYSLQQRIDILEQVIANYQAKLDYQATRGVSVVLVDAVSMLDTLRSIAKGEEHGGEQTEPKQERRSQVVVATLKNSLEFSVLAMGYTSALVEDTKP